MPTVSPSMLSATASEFVPSFHAAVTTKEVAAVAVGDNVPTVPKLKKTREMRGPRKRNRDKKAKGDNCSVDTSISHSQFGDEDDAMSYLSLEASYPGEYYDNDGADNLSYNNVSYPNKNHLNDQINPLTRKRWSSNNSNNRSTPEKMSDQLFDSFGRQYMDYPGSSPAEFENEFLTGAHSAAEGDWSHWFDNVCEQFGRSGSPDNLSAPFLAFNPRATHKRTPSECSQDSWLDLQQEWVTSKQLVSESDDIVAEELERKKWGEWAMHASEKERQRRITAIEVMDVAQDEERAARGRWALEAIERERNERISAHFLVSLASTNWFNETISAYSEDYELVCPYYRMGCKVSCRRSTLEVHLNEECIHARQIKDMDIANKQDNFRPDDYEIICPNAFMGCTYTCNRKNLHDHLLSCSFNGISKEQDLEERQLTKQAVIQECEDERVRRQKHLSKGSGYWSDQSDLSDKTRHRKLRPDDADSEGSVSPRRGRPQSPMGSPISATSPTLIRGPNRGPCGKRPTPLPSGALSNSQSLHHLLRSQVQSVVSSLHDETAAAWAARLEEQRARRPSYEGILSSLRLSVAKLWHFCRVESYGSYSTGLSDSSSDLDLVVCFSDECQTLLGLKGVVPLLHLLAEYLTKEAGHLIQITNIIIHARVPIIKAVTVDPHLHCQPHIATPGFSPGYDGSKYQPISIDISIDSPLHSGLATTEMVCTLMQALPPLGPVVSVLKDYLKLRGLSDAFTGGLNSYGLFILMLLPLLKTLRDSRDLLGCEPIGGVPGGTGGTAGCVSSVTESADAKGDALQETPDSLGAQATIVPGPEVGVGVMVGVGVGSSVVPTATSPSAVDCTTTSVAKSSTASSNSSAINNTSSKQSDAPLKPSAALDPHACDDVIATHSTAAESPLKNFEASIDMIPAGNEGKIGRRFSTSSDSVMDPEIGIKLDGRAFEKDKDREKDRDRDRDKVLGGSKVTSVYMEAVARAALSRRNSSSMIAASAAKEPSIKKSTVFEATVNPSPALSDALTLAVTVPKSERKASLATRPRDIKVAVAAVYAHTIAKTDNAADVSDAMSSELPTLTPTASPVAMPHPLSEKHSLAASTRMPSTPQSSPSTIRKSLSGERNTPGSAASRLILPARPPLRPTPPVTLKEYLSTKHLLHSTYTVARSALKPSHNESTLPPMSPPQVSSPSSPSKTSTPPSTSSKSLYASSGIASNPSKNFVSAFTSNISTCYNNIRPKSATSFPRSPIATPKQGLGHSQLSSAKKFPIRFIFASPPPFTLPYNSNPSPSSSSISKAGALYIMNVMNSQRGYTWNNLKQQREFGRKVAFKLLDTPDNGDFGRNNRVEQKKPNFRNSVRDMRVQCVLPADTPILGSLLQAFLISYGEELQCGRHGYSARDYGFRFDIDIDSEPRADERKGPVKGPGPGVEVAPTLPKGEVKEGAPPPIHPHAGDPLLVEDPVNVMNNVTKNCYKAPAVQKAFFEALERFKGIAVRRRPLNSSSALSPVYARRRFQFPAATTAAVPIGPNKKNPPMASPKEDTKEHSSVQTISGCKTADSGPFAVPSTTHSSHCDIHSTDEAKSNCSLTPPPTPSTSPIPVQSLPGDPYSLIKEIFGVDRWAC